MGKLGFYCMAVSMGGMAYGAMISYVLLLKDTLASVIAELVFGANDRHIGRVIVLWILAWGILLPLSSQRDMARLAWTSQVSVVFDIGLVGLVTLQAVTTSSSSKYYYSRLELIHRPLDQTPNALCRPWCSQFCFCLSTRCLSNCRFLGTSPTPMGPSHNIIHQYLCLPCSSLWLERLSWIWRRDKRQHFEQFASRPMECKYRTYPLGKYHVVCVSDGMLCRAPCLCDANVWNKRKRR